MDRRARWWVLLALVAGGAHATSSKMDFLPLGSVRTDALLAPTCLSSHVHTFYGASVDLRPEITYADLRAATESTTNVEENKSLYWHPSVYMYEASTGVYSLVPIMFGSAYYVWQTGETSAFPDGFNMIVNGDDPRARVEVVCDGPSECERGDCSTTSTFFPAGACWELEVKIIFPTCWDGVNAQSENMMDHVSFDTEGGWFDADCPASHPVKLPEIHFYFRIHEYRGGQYVFSDGTDVLHADYFNGWDSAELQSLLDDCENESDAASPDFFCEEHLTFRDYADKPNKPDDFDIRTELLNIYPSQPYNPRATVSAEQITCIAALPIGNGCGGDLIPAGQSLSSAPYLDPTDLSVSCDGVEPAPTPGPSPGPTPPGATGLESAASEIDAAAAPSPTLLLLLLPWLCILYPRARVYI